MSDVIIIGAGITGLSCAWRLKRLGVESVILESSGRPGGVIMSERIGEYLVERGPNSLLPSSDNFTLLDEAGLTSEIIEGDPKAPRYVCIDHRLRKVPFEPLTFTGLLRAAGEPFVRSKSPANESVHDFFTRRFGLQAQDRLVAPFVTGIYAGNTKELGMAATFPKFVKMEREYGSLVLGMMRSRKPPGARRGRTCSFAEGMETLPRRLAAGCNIVYNERDLRVSRDLAVQGAFGELRAKVVIVTAPSAAAARVLGEGFPAIAKLLEGVDYAPMVTATSSLPDSAFPQPLRGFGFLVPRSEKLHILGTLFNSALFPGRAPAGRQLLTTFVGGAHEREAVHWPDDRIWNAVRSELQTVLRTSTAPEPISVARYPHAIPQYKIGHDRWAADFKNQLKRTPGLFVCGNYLDGVSLASCMETGERIAREVAVFAGRTS